MSTFAEVLSDFVVGNMTDGVPAPVAHEAKRLILNQFKASVQATDEPAVRVMAEWACDNPATRSEASILWIGERATPEIAAVVNGVLFDVLDFNETYLPGFLHVTSAVLPAVLATAEQLKSSGRDVVNAVAVGVEATLACASVVLPSGYYRGFLPGGLVGGVGAAAGSAALRRLDREQTRNAIAIAMCTPFGCYEAVGSTAFPYIVGTTARSGYSAADMAARGMTAPATAFEGDKGMLGAYSDANRSAIAGSAATLGKSWRIGEQCYKTMPTETITHAPLECVLALRSRVRGREVDHMTFRVAPVVKTIADERRERFGTPSSSSEARFDLRHCVAAAWHRGRFTLDEMSASAYKDPQILETRSKISLEADSQRLTFEGAALEIGYTDGTTDSIEIDAFRGTVSNPLTDDQLKDIFRECARGRMAAGDADALCEAVMALEKEDTIERIMKLAAVEGVHSGAPAPGPESIREAGHEPMASSKGRRR